MYRVTIKPKTSFITEMTSSTLFGAACWAIKDVFGDDILAEVFKDDNSLAFSNAFISGYIPTGCIKDNSLKNIKTGEETSNTIQVFRIDHCEVNRETNNSNKHWISYEHFETRNLDIYVSSNLFNKEEIMQIFNVMLTKGLGQAKSKGKGQFELIEIAEVSIEELGDKNPNGYMIISDYIPNKKDSTIGIYSARVIKRKTKDGISCKPVYVLNAGSKFIGKTSGEIIGRLEKDEDTGTYLSGRAIVIPINT